MTIKVSDVMRHVRNHFVRSAVTGTFIHLRGVLTPLTHFKPGMWVAVTGEDAPSGIYQLDENGGIPDLEDMNWTGTVYVLDPPADFLRLCGDIGIWSAAHENSPVTSEKFGEYSVTRQPMTWETAFAPALAPYRRMFTEVPV